VYSFVAHGTGHRRVTAAVVVIVGMAVLFVAPEERAFAKLPGSGRTEHVVPKGVSASDWSCIRAAYDANRHAAFAVLDGWQARNPGQGWRTLFDGRGFEARPDSGAWSWGLELISYGRDGAERAVETPVCVDASGGRVEYEWDENLTEWYINDARGLEHGYTIHQRPSLAGCPKGATSPSPGLSPAATTLGPRFDHDSNPDRVVAQPRLGLLVSDDSVPRVAATRQPWAEGQNAFGVPSGELLQLTLAVRGNLRPRVSASGQDVTFVNDGGAAVVNYSGLRVFDATGAIVPAWFEDGGLPSQISNLQARFIRVVIEDADAIYPLTIDPIAQQAYLKASNPGTNDSFGESVAVSGDTVVVGAPGESSNATGVNGNQGSNTSEASGAAYVFVRSGDAWSQQAYLKASNTGAIDLFGYSVDLSGDTVVVGAFLEDSSATGVNGNQSSNSAPDSGAAYVFSRTGTTWTQQAYLKASNTGAGDDFGSAVAVSGNTILVGADLEDSSATGVNGNQLNNSAADSGAAYVFIRSDGVWSQQSYFKPSNTGAGDRFGWSVTLSDDTLVVGALLEDSIAAGVNGNEADNSAPSAGAAYVFRLSDEDWSQEAYLKASNPGGSDQFGYSVAASDDRVVVGAWNEDSNATDVNGDQTNNSALQSGAAYVFVRSDDEWTQEAYLKASNTGAGDGFGHAVAMNEDTIVVSAIHEDSNSTGINGNQASNTAGDSGAVYIYVRDPEVGAWSPQTYVKASNTGAMDYFGRSVALSGDTVVIGAWAEDSIAAGVNGNQANNSAADAGAAYLFTGVGLDTDNDGVVNAEDDCPNNAPSLPVDCTGRPLRDANEDCLVDDADVSFIVDELLQVTVPPTGCDGLPLRDANGDGLVDGLDLQIIVDEMIGQ